MVPLRGRVGRPGGPSAIEKTIGQSLCDVTHAAKSCPSSRMVQVGWPVASMLSTRALSGWLADMLSVEAGCSVKSLQNIDCSKSRGCRKLFVCNKWRVCKQVDGQRGRGNKGSAGRGCAMP